MHGGGGEFIRGKWCKITHIVFSVVEMNSDFPETFVQPLRYAAG